MKDKLFLIGSVLTIAAGALMGITNIFIQDDSPMFAIMGFVLVFFGIIALITGYTSPSVAQSKEGVTLAYLMIIASVLIVIGSFDPLALWPLLLIGGGLLILSVFCLWPCVCCQGKTKNRDKVIGVASAHDSITIHEISQRSGLSTTVVSDLLYDAIGKGQLVGKMEGSSFIRGRPTTTTYSGPTTREREIVKVLVICPYCGAKTEQGLAKCQNCKADL